MPHLASRALGAISCCAVIAACGSSSPSSTSGTTTGTPGAQVFTCQSGSATASGSTALQPLAQQAAQAFAAACPGATVNVSGGGSSVGLSNVASGTSDIGDSDVPASLAKTIDSSQLKDHQVAIVVFAVIVNPAAHITSLTSAQVRDVFSGKVANWKDVGGADAAVTLVERKPGSGTRLTFDKDVMQGTTESATPASTQDSTQLVLQSISGAPGGVSYIAAGSATSAVTKVMIDGAASTSSDVQSGKYVFYAHEHMYTKGDGSPVAQSFIAYILGSAFQQQVVSLGFLPTGTTSRQSAVDQG